MSLRFPDDGSLWTKHVGGSKNTYNLLFHYVTTLEYVHKCLQAQYAELIILNMLNMFEVEKAEGKNWIAKIRKHGALEMTQKMRRITVYIFNHLLLA